MSLGIRSSIEESNPSNLLKLYGLLHDSNQHSSLYNNIRMQALERQKEAQLQRIMRKKQSRMKIFETQNILNDLIIESSLDQKALAPLKEPSIERYQEDTPKTIMMTKDNIKLTSENAQLANRLISRQCTLPRKELESFFQSHKKYSAIRSKFKQVSLHQPKEKIKLQSLSVNQSLIPQENDQFQHINLDNSYRNIHMKQSINLSPITKSPSKQYGDPFKEYSSPYIDKNLRKNESKITSLTEPNEEEIITRSNNIIRNRSSKSNERYGFKDKKQAFEKNIGIRFSEFDMFSSLNTRNQHDQYQFLFQQDYMRNQYSQIFSLSQITLQEFQVFLSENPSITCTLLKINEGGIIQVCHIYLYVGNSEIEGASNLNVPIYSQEGMVKDPIGEAELLLRINHLKKQTSNELNIRKSYKSYNSPLNYSFAYNNGSSPQGSKKENFQSSSSIRSSPKSRIQNEGFSFNSAITLDDIPPFLSKEERKNFQEMEDLKVTQANQNIFNMKAILNSTAISQSHKGNVAKQAALKSRLNQIKIDLKNSSNNQQEETSRMPAEPVSPHQSNYSIQTQRHFKKRKYDEFLPSQQEK